MFGGFYDVSDDMMLYVDTGIGNTKVPFRFFNVPQITVLYLKPDKRGYLIRR